MNVEFLLTEIFRRRIDVVDEFTVLFLRSFPLIIRVTRAAKKILPGSVHTLIVRHSVRTMTEKLPDHSKFVQGTRAKWDIKM